MCERQRRCEALLPISGVMVMQNGLQIKQQNTLICRLTLRLLSSRVVLTGFMWYNLELNFSPTRTSQAGPNHETTGIMHLYEFGLEEFMVLRCVFGVRILKGTQHDTSSKTCVWFDGCYLNDIGILITPDCHPRKHHTQQVIFSVLYPY